MTDNSSSKVTSEESQSFDIEQNWAEGFGQWSLKSDDNGDLQLYLHGNVIFMVFFHGNWSVEDKKIVADCMMDRNVIVGAQSAVIVSNSSIPGIKLMLRKGVSRRSVIRCLQKHEKIAEKGRTIEQLFEEFCQHAEIDEHASTHPSNFESYLEMISIAGEEFAFNYIQSKYHSTPRNMYNAINSIEVIREDLYRKMNFSKVTPESFDLIVATHSVVSPNLSMLRFFESVKFESNEKSNVLHQRYRTTGWVMASSGETDIDLVKRFSVSLNDFTNELDSLDRKASTSFQMSQLMCLMMIHFGLEDFMAAWDCVKARSEVNTRNIASDICLVAEYISNGGNASMPFEWIQEVV